MKLIFAIPIKFNGTNVAREEKRGEKKKKKEESRSRNKRCSFFIFILQLASCTNFSNEIDFRTFSDLDAVTFYIWNATCKIRVQQSRSLRSFNPFPPPSPSLPIVLFRTCRILYDFSFRSKNTRRLLSFVVYPRSSILNFPVEKWPTKKQIGPLKAGRRKTHGLRTGSA